MGTEYLSDGKPLMPNTLELKVFIDSQAATAVADKGVFGAQMKSVISKVFTSNITTESGVKIDATFSYTSLLGRIVLSPILMGTTNRLLKHVSPIIAQTYFK